MRQEVSSSIANFQLMSCNFPVAKRDLPRYSISKLGIRADQFVFVKACKYRLEERHLLKQMRFPFLDGPLTEAKTAAHVPAFLHAYLQCAISDIQNLSLPVMLTHKLSHQYW